MLESVGVSLDGVKVIMFLIPEDRRIAEMADFLLKNKDAKETEIIVLDKSNSVWYESKKQFAFVRWKNHNWTEKERPEIRGVLSLLF